MTKVINCGNLKIGGNNKITVQSMLNFNLSNNINQAIDQVKLLEANGCDIIRASIDSEEDAKAIKTLKKYTNMPIIADIQFDYKMALYAVENGIDAIRINPCYIGSEDNVKKVIEACKDKNIPIRVGVNSGSVKKEFLDKYNGVNQFSLVESALEQVKLVEKYNYDNIVISIKATNVKLTYDANIELKKRTDYPIHLGITESGSDEDGIIKTSMGLGSLILLGIGDTIRVSLTEDPVREVIIGRKILQYLGLRPYGIDVISCPTCGRTKVDLINIVKDVKKAVAPIKKDIKIAIMGCAVNGPGEAREADIGFASGNGEALLFKKGEIIRKVNEEEIIKVLLEEIEKIN
ncbi:flavodoxin-dependent (E)-4-hydroxy-3-methylbut-2-enyl-diphosphate synthase [Sedimentibacter sp. zth1]|uniref:flavodoxin-dependent (E)-4-hydroxy-3-methylbut-2-enyl-diphosphate synthase n=1 Tax=Sedimentibacter sp. zth1 TaxID=2816908 RepID=UPI001A917B23|nr:flavodoxin-dependent (E)-4-hydroxy-3-methylbut-2-enyl-diphosphate synthase [Sedimentibacter sp. zth1]QSX06551.1 flavodoxin-dependent (E)-4-hydroxy-3-methylbut-2-enyl-diphosphate synthase [Sedimentibacter sp. zth1]